MNAIARMLVFDALGHRRQSVDDEFRLADAASEPFSSIFQRRMNENPGRFSWNVELAEVGEIAIQWDSVFQGTGTATITIGGAAAGLSVLLTGMQPYSESAILESLANGLAAKPGGTFHPAFKAFAAELHRPLIAVLRFLPANTDAKVSALRTIHRSLAYAFFRTPAQIQPAPIPAVSA